MSENSKIEWTEATWNPVTGCTKYTSGCDNCYAYTMAKRLKCMGNVRYKNGFDVTLHYDLLRKPFDWKSPRYIFVNSMSDLFHEEVPTDFILEVYKTMAEAKRHTFQVLTKRSERLKELSSALSWTPNIWQGVTVENEDFLSRLDDLREIPAFIKFVSFEPLIGKIENANLDQIDWVIVGGESGVNARPMKEEWVLSIRDMCLEKNIPFFFKQWGGFNKKKNGRILIDRTWDQYPKKY